MVLFKLPFLLCNSIFAIIYIPLWSYSNEKLFLYTLQPSYLHSTMVLFKSGRSIFRINNYKLFTFHYGPIQISDIFLKLMLLSSFTFHYGPIQIWKADSQRYCSKRIYIPLWSYSNDSRKNWI